VRGGPHRAALARGENAENLKKNHVKIQIVSFICVCVQEKQSVTASVYLSSAIMLGPWLRPVRTSTLLVLVLRQLLALDLRETYALNRLSSFKNLRRKGDKFDHCPGRPRVLLRHCYHITIILSPVPLMVASCFIINVLATPKLV